MKSLPTEMRFRTLVCEMLDIPADAGEKELKQALESKGSQLYSWYQMRIRAIKEYAQLQKSS